MSAPPRLDAGPWGGLGDLLAAVFLEAVHGVDIAALVASALLSEPRPQASRARLFAVGKAAPAMAQGALLAWPGFFERALVVAPDGTPCDLGDREVEVLRADHPLPGARSVVAAERALELADVGEGGLFVALVSGGASALLAAPPAGVTLDDEIALTRELLASGARVTEMNVIRRHISRVRGGRLGARAVASGGRVLGLVASDVIGGTLADVGSGPTVTSLSSEDDARALLLRYAPRFSALKLLPAPPPLPKGAAETRLLVEPSHLVELAARALASRGFAVTRLAPSLATVDDLAAEYAQIAATLAPHEAYVRVAEPSLRVPGGGASRGEGGRAGHLAALVAPLLAEGTAFLAGASDGVDGTSGTAGAVVDRASVLRVGVERFTSAACAFDTGALHRTAGTALPLGPTGVNLCDLHVIARGP